ncbi:hypothetical protein ACKLNR_015099 [Fusarium oxysporum f. sp. zingiberi]
MQVKPFLFACTLYMSLATATPLEKKGSVATSETHVASPPVYLRRALQERQDQPNPPVNSHPPTDSGFWNGLEEKPIFGPLSGAWINALRVKWRAEKSCTRVHEFVMFFVIHDQHCLLQ